MIDFAALPPEINSARMYSGPGSGPLLAAAAAWNTMAAEIRSAADSYGSVITGLTSEGWFGPSSMLMSAAAAPYLEWLSTTANQAEQAGSQANAAAAAYESAYAMTVPPAVIAANRVQLSNLLATNIVGQNTAAIAATEAQYAEMWAQDAAAMYGYATASSVAAQLTPFGAPQSSTNPEGVADQTNAVAQATSPSSAANAASVLSALTGLGGITTPGSNTATTGLAGILNDLDGSNDALLGSFISNATFANFTNAFTTSGLLNPTSFIDAVTAYSFLYGASASSGAAAASGGSAAASDLGAGLGGAASLGSAATAELSRANMVGALSVPPSWGGTGATVNSALSTTHIGAGAYQSLTGTPMVMEDVGSVGMPGVPMAGLPNAADDEFGNLPIYGFKLHILGRPPAAG